MSKRKKNISFSMAVKTKGILTKRLSLDDDETGEIIKDGSECRMAHGTLHTYNVTIDKFCAGLKSMASSKALVHGIPVNYKTDDKPVTILSKAKFKGVKNTITRTKDHIVYPAGPGLMYLDHDKCRPYSVAKNPEALKEYTPENLLNLISTFFPEILNAEYVATASTSSYIYDKDDVELRGPGSGAHVYLFPSNAKDIPRFLETLGRRFILQGFGRIEVSKSGSLLIRTPVDLSVGSPERLDFVAGAVLEDGLQQKRPDPVHKKGELLDTTLLKDLSSDEITIYKEIVAELKDSAADLQEKIKKEYVKKEITKITTKSPEITKEKAIQIIESRQHYILMNHDILYFDKHSDDATLVSDIIKSKGAGYDKKTLADPLEPDYDGSSKTKAIFYWNNGNPVINSFAHGNIKYRFESINGDKAQKDTEKQEKKESGEDSYYTPDALKALRELNEEYSAVLISGKFRIIQEAFDDSAKKHTIDFLEIGSFLNFYSNRRVFVKTSADKLKQVPIGALWKDWEERKTFKSVVFAPGNNCQPSAYNLFRGFPITPAEGDWGLMRHHIEHIICDGDHDHFIYLMCWMARIIQDPGGKRPGVAVMIKGGKGVGKGIFVNNFGKMFGEAFIQLTSQHSFTGQFNMHLAKCLLCFLDEAIWGGDKHAEGKLKGIITEPNMMFEPKGIDSVSLANHINVIGASNEDWVCPATEDERRFFILTPNNSRAEDIPYFEAIGDQLDNGGLEAWMHELKNWDYEQVELRNAPKTEGLTEQVERSMDDVMSFWHHVLDRGFLLSDRLTGEPKKAMSGAEQLEWPESAWKFEVYFEFETNFCKNRQHISRNNAFWRKTWDFWHNGIDGIKKGTDAVGGRKYMITMDRLGKMKKMFTAHTRIEFDNSDPKLIPF